MNKEINNYACCILNKEEEVCYSQYIENHPKATFEYTLAWKNILEKNFSFKPCYIICKDKTNQVKGVLPLFEANSIFGKRLVSLPYVVYLGIIANDEEARNTIIHYSKSFADKENVDYLEIREKKMQNYPSDFKLVRSTFNFSLSLPGSIDMVWKKLKKEERKAIKKAKKSSLSFSKGNSLAMLKEFYNLFLLTRKFRGVPSYPYAYFEDIVKNMSPYVKIYMAKLGEEPISSLIVIYFKNEARCMFAGSLHNQEMKCMQSYSYLLWEAIKEACFRRCAVFHFGGATENTNEGGLYNFKRKWADTIIDVHSYFYLNKARKIPRSDNDILLRIASKIWGKLPLSLIKFLSPKVIKQFV